MTILFLCRERDLQREPLGYARAFRKLGIRIEFAADGCALNENIKNILARSAEKPALILQPESDLQLLPEGLDEIDVPTACFHFDPYAYLHRRIRWAMLFDYAVLFHPGFEEAFRRAGHPNPVTLPHAVDAEFFAAPATERLLDVGWVGRSGGWPYITRRRVLEKLAANFRMNEWSRHHSYEELAQVYCTSKIVVNVGRDDYPGDVSLRFAEAMAAGALFLTLLPSEITQLGFQDGVHFVGVPSEAEILDTVRYYLDHDADRRRIAEAGRGKSLSEHTYDARAEELLRIVRENKGKMFAPARSWPEARVRLARLDYFAANRKLDYACGELRRIARTDLPRALKGGMLIGRACVAQLRLRIASKKAKDDSRNFKQRTRDYFAGFLAALPGPVQGFVFRRFRRPILWWLFRAYGTSLAFAPAGPRDCRFRMWLDPAAYSDFILGTYEPGCTQVLRQCLKHGSCCVDVGANLGYFSIFMSLLVGEQGRVVAFEPMRDTVEMLRKNVCANRLGNVNVVAAAVSDRSGSVDLLNDPSQRLSKTASMIGYRLEGSAQSTTVPSVRLDEYFAGATRLPDLIKIDVEGAELCVLNGARELLARARPTLVVEIHGWGSPASQKVLDFLSEVGYSADIFEVREPEALCLATPSR